jgi:ABC-type oligopeptide transport system substrate-binding subunit
MITVAASCQSVAPPAHELATDQTLHLPIATDIDRSNTLDPVLLSPQSVAYAIANNVFDGLYRYDEQLREVPDIAQAMPDISGDGMTYTFHLRRGVRFSNGDAVTSAEVLYSWNRAVATSPKDNGVIFAPVLGYQTVAQAFGAGLPPPALAGISAPDPYTVVARLTAPAGYWLAELALPGAWVVNKTAIEASGEKDWSTTPDGLIGTGPFRMTEHVSGQSLLFSPVRNWWGGSTGTLERIELDVVPDADSRWRGYVDGRYDILGYGISDDLQSSEATSLARLRSDKRYGTELHTWTSARTDWVGFNIATGPFAGVDHGRDLRLAFSEAIDRQQLARAVCASGTLCAPATGGLISKGLLGYLGDGSDSAYRFAPSAARATIKRLDPDGSRFRGLVYYYNSTPLMQSVAENLRAQWLANLGVDVSIRGLGRVTFFTDRAFARYTIFRGSWLADYNHPQDWFDNLFLDGNSDNSGAAYNNAVFNNVVTSSDRQALATALPTYKQTGQMLVDDAIVAPLLYYVRAAIVKPYVDGYGANALWDYRWTVVQILGH